jgi:phosphatidylglycerol lysyltransferase
MEVLLLKYGYVLLFLGVIVEGEVFLIAGAFLAHRGYFDLPVVIAVAITANAVANQLYYRAARARGRDWLERRRGARARYRTIIERTARHGPLLLLGSRFAYGFRVVIPAACGAVGMSPLVFTICDLISGALWAVVVAFIGIHFGAAVIGVLVNARRVVGWVLLAAGLAAAAVLGARRLQRQVRLRELGMADVHALIPFLIGLMGTLNLASALWPRSPTALVAVERWLPLMVVQGSRVFMLFAGFALLQVTRNLARRKEVAWWVATAALAVSLLSHLGRAFDLQHSLVAALLLAYLLLFRRRFHARTDPISVTHGLLLLPVLGLAVLAYGTVGLRDLADGFAWPPGTHAMTEAFRTGLLTLEPRIQPLTRDAARFQTSLEVAGWLSRLYVLLLFLRPVVLRDRQEASREAVGRIFRSHGRLSLAAVAVREDKHHLLVAGGRGLVSYQTSGPIAIACGDPLCPDEDFEACVREFVQHARGHGWTPCVYGAAEQRLSHYRSMGLGSFKIADEGLIDVPSFSLAGEQTAALRSLVRAAEKAGLRVRRYDRAHAPDPATDEQLESISEEWLRERRLGELGFSLGQFALESLGSLTVFVCEADGGIQAFASWLPYRAGEAAVLDLLRGRSGEPAGTMELLVACSLSELQSAGLSEASLGLVPQGDGPQDMGALDRGIAFLFERANPSLGDKSLDELKKRFGPRWEGRYLIYPRGAELPRVAYALAAVHTPSGMLRALLT